MPDKFNSKYCAFVLIWTEVMTYTGFGISLAALNPSTPAVVDFINGTYLTRYSVPVSNDAKLLIISLAQSMVLVGAIIGASGVRFFTDMFSRKFNILCVHLLVLLSTILMGPVPKATGSYEVLIVGRLLNGISRGVAYTCVPIYIAETCNRKSLPLYQAPSVLLIFSGILIANCIGHPKVLGGVYTWPYLLASPGIFSVLYVISYPFLPNTPVYILRYSKSEDRSAEALNVLQKLRRTSSEKTKKELATLKKEIEGDIKLEKVGLLDVIRDPHYRIQLLAAVIVMLTFPMSGVDGIIMYTDNIFELAGISNENIPFATMGVFAAVILASLLGFPVTSRIGTRKILIGGISIAVFALILLTITSAIDNVVTSYISIAFVFIFFVGIGLGPSQALFSLTSELTTQVSRPSVLWISGVIFWIVSTLIALVFPYMLKAMGSYSFIPFAFVSLLEILYIHFAVPDAHNRSVEEIQTDFARRASGVKRKESTGSGINNPSFELKTAV